ncbi:ribosomal protein L1, putative [Babesia bigemina]|uniref:Ribosomal protein L1, putative n=1 Tax=Babesia bigemina TaxID=5866 RepID=A0A061D0Z1_BABBI|nr:ribosomal protein L1, putative [Babesia bigemina]CDR94481.1 ribosomal protein L1, putative [Babesia bigemina]|eukprot:XP_012766667.1 ribosomal protein L1, putative [Babesia bigemina]
MLHTAVLSRALAERCRCVLTQTRTKKYLPFYANTRKNQAKRGKQPKSEQRSDGPATAAEADNTRHNLVSRLATPDEALEVLRSLRCAAINADVAAEQYRFRLWTRVDVKRTALRGMAVLPHPVGPKPRVVAICEEEEATLALECGAAYAGLDSILERIAGGWTNFDTCVTTTIHMPKLVKVARILGPKKLMPNMKEGTLCSNLLEAVRRLSSSNALQFRATPIDDAEFDTIQAMVSPRKKLDFEVDNVAALEVPIAQGGATPQVVVENAKHFVVEVMKQRPPATAKVTTNEFKWPPVRKTVNSILEDAFSTLGTTHKADNQFIVGGAFGLARQGQSMSTPIIFDTGLLL